MIFPKPGEVCLADPIGVRITGFLSPFLPDGQPWLIRMPGNDSRWVSVFSTEDKLDKACFELGIGSCKVKQITDGREFVLSALEKGLRVMLDPYIVRGENGDPAGSKTRWTEVVMESEGGVP